MSETLHRIAITLLPIETWDLHAGLSRWWGWNINPFSFGWFFLVAIPVGFAFRGDRKLFTRLLFVTTPLLLLFVCAYGPALRHTGILFLYLVYFLAQIPSERRNAYAYFGIGFGPFVATLFWLWVWNPIEPRFAFADGPSLVPYFQEAETIYTLEDFILFPTMAETGRDVYDIRFDRVATYPNFRNFPIWRSIDDFCTRLDRYPLKPGDLLVFPREDGGAFQRLGNQCGNWEFVYQSVGNFATDEAFRVFRFRDSAAK